MWGLRDVIPPDFDECNVYEGASTANFVLSIGITVGIFVSYLPQYRRIWLNKTSEGLSVSFLLLGSCLSLFTLTNIVLISSRARKCCTVLSAFNCANSQINLVQIGLQSLSAVMILVLVLWWTRDLPLQDKAELARIERVGRVVVVHAVAAVLQVVVGLNSNRGVLIGIANANGLLSTLLTVVKYVPQIYTTFRLKHPGTLSVGMMCIQTPGGFVFTATLFFTKGLHWSSWVLYLVAACLQGILLTMCLYYEYFKRGETEYHPLEDGGEEEREG